MNLVTIDAKKRFLDKLAGISDPEAKRKIIGTEFIRVFEGEIKKASKCRIPCTRYFIH
jgi:GMP synthase (glutamine-hydrolysing)